MSNELLFGSPECDIHFNPELNVIQTRWKGIYVEGDRLRTIFNEIILALEKKKVSTIVADAREMHIISYKDQQWTINDWYPRAVKAGFRHQALILNTDSFNEITVKQIAQQYDEATVTTQYFSSPEDALTWARYMRNLEFPPFK